MTRRIGLKLLKKNTVNYTIEMWAENPPQVMSNVFILPTSVLSACNILPQPKCPGGVHG